ncbi:MAG: sulfite exporter TauE/SafE family protein [Cyanobacteria bacterium J06560_6]
MAQIFWVGGVITLAACVQSIAGFGFALVAIALLPFIIDLQLATPLVLMLALLSSVSLVIYHRKSFEWKAIAPLLISALIMVPIGLVSINYLPEQIALRVLGGFILLYVLLEALGYTSPKPGTRAHKKPPLPSSVSAYLFGGIAGFLTGAFTVPGPPLVMHATAQAWRPEKLKANVPVIIAIVQLAALIGNVYEGNLTAEFWQLALYSLPFFGVGAGVSLRLSARVDEKVFKKIVLVLLGCIGLMWVL